MRRRQDGHTLGPLHAVPRAPELRNSVLVRHIRWQALWRTWSRVLGRWALLCPSAERDAVQIGRQAGVGHKALQGFDSRHGGAGGALSLTLTMCDPGPCTLGTSRFADDGFVTDGVQHWLHPINPKGKYVLSDGDGNEAAVGPKELLAGIEREPGRPDPGRTRRSATRSTRRPGLGACPRGGVLGSVALPSKSNSGPLIAIFALSPVRTVPIFF